jgi:ABC-type multidrug transport system ATPase subunit
MGLCDRVYAMEAGRVIAEGTPNEVRHNPAVVASYLGSKEAAISRSGAGSSKQLGSGETTRGSAGARR